MATTPPETSHDSRNRDTIFGTQSPLVSQDKMDQAWGLARKALFNVPKPNVPGYALFWTNGLNVGAGHLAVGTSSYVIIGRHTNSDIVLGTDPTLSLRHLLARAVHLTDGSLALRLLDLKTNLPFYLDDDVPRRSIMASGPVLVRIGEYVLGGVPTDPFELKALGQGPYRARPAPLIRESQEIPKFSGRSPGRASVITALPPLPMIGDISKKGESQAGRHRITIGKGYRTISFWLGNSELDAGVLVGRAAKCIDKGLYGILDQNISRAHVLLLRENEGCSIFDLCSTQGTHSANTRVRHVRVPITGTMVTMGKVNSVDLWWHPPGD